MKEICKDRLYIGNREDAFACLTEDTDVTHILTVEAEPLSGTDVKYDKGGGEILLKHVRCLDQIEADLLSHLNECIQFIEEGLKHGKVLVHCSAGVSRSATVILAFMMHSQDIALEKALRDLKAIYPKADPNPGFMFQLHLFEAMGRKVDKSNSLFKQYNLQIIAKQFQQTGYRELPKGILKEEPETGVKMNNYRCRKCR